MGLLPARTIKISGCPILGVVRQGWDCKRQTSHFSPEKQIQIQTAPSGTEPCMLSIIPHPQALYQGTTSVAPSPTQRRRGFSPCASTRNCHPWSPRILRVHLKLSFRPERSEVEEPAVPARTTKISGCPILGVVSPRVGLRAAHPDFSPGKQIQIQTAPSGAEVRMHSIFPHTPALYQAAFCICLNVPSSGRIAGMRHRERWTALAGAILLTIALPIAIDQGYFRYNPYVLPWLSVGAALLYIGFAVTSRPVTRRLSLLIRKGTIMGPTLCIGLFAVTGALVGTSFWLALQASKGHVAAEKAQAGEIPPKGGGSPPEGRAPGGGAQTPNISHDGTGSPDQSQPPPSSYGGQPSVKGNLTIVDFDSFHEATFANDSGWPIFILSGTADFTVAGRQLSQGWIFDFNVSPHETKTFAMKPPDGTYVTFPPKEITWEQEWELAKPLGNCAGPNFLSPSNFGLKQVESHYASEGFELPVGNASGTISYRRGEAIRQVKFPLKMLLVHIQGCQPATARSLN
jgi:hypothetical protein